MDIGLSEVDALIGETDSVGQVGPARFPVESVKVEMPPREELTAQNKFLKPSMFYPSQSAKILLKGFLEPNSIMVLHLGHTTTKFSADQTIQLAGAVSSDVSSAS